MEDIWGCRSFLSPWKNDKGEYQSYGRTNLGVVTINLADVALSSEGDFDKFWKIFDERLELAHQAHLICINNLKNKRSDCAPILWQYGALARLKSGEKIGQLFYGGRTSCSFGYAALAECVKYMTGESHSKGKGLEFGLEVMKHFNDVLAKYTAEDNIGYSPYGSPIESTTYKFAKCLKKRFGVIEGITDKDYVTNSYHVNVREEIDPFEKLDVEAKYQALSLGGCISYVETANLQDNIEAVLAVIDHIYNNIMYAELNTKSDYCSQCGSASEQLIDSDMNWYCPVCGCKDPMKLYHARRVCGYIGTNEFNKGRTQDIKERYVHVDNHEV
jgi:ribonucleoside-triphosphate reductase